MHHKNRIQFSYKITPQLAASKSWLTKCIGVLGDSVIIVQKLLSTDSIQADDKSVEGAEDCPLFTMKDLEKVILFTKKKTEGAEAVCLVTGRQHVSLVQENWTLTWKLWTLFIEMGYPRFIMTNSAPRCALTHYEYARQTQELPWICVPNYLLQILRNYLKPALSPRRRWRVRGKRKSLRGKHKDTSYSWTSASPEYAKSIQW